jgi:hypothetical protein
MPCGSMAAIPHKIESSPLVTQQGYEANQTTALKLHRWIMFVFAIFQIVLAIAFMASFESRGFFVLYINPFFIGAAVCGLWGTFKLNRISLLIYIMGSAGVSCVFIMFSILEYVAVDHSWSYLAFYLPYSVFVIVASVEAYMLYRLIKEPSTTKRDANEPSPPHIDPTHSTTEDWCIVCVERPRETVILPCGHMCVCVECGHKLKSQHYSCPFCRKAIADIVKVYK